MGMFRKCENRFRPVKDTGTTAGDTPDVAITRCPSIGRR
jgi:hypothetical protein